MKIAGMEIQREYYLVYHKSKFLTKSMKVFLEYAEKKKGETNRLEKQQM